MRLTVASLTPMATAVTRGLVRREQVEHAVAFFGGHAVAVVFDDIDGKAIAALGAHDDLRSRARVVGNRVGDKT